MSDNQAQSQQSQSQQSQTADNTKPEKTLAVRLLRGYFHEDSKKLKAGEVHELPISVAKKLVNSRKAEIASDDD